MNEKNSKEVRIMKFGWGKARVKNFSDNLEMGYRQINWVRAILVLIIIAAVVTYIYLEIH